jgi:hypothetical protein
MAKRRGQPVAWFSCTRAIHSRPSASVYGCGIVPTQRAISQLPANATRSARSSSRCARIRSRAVSITTPDDRVAGAAPPVIWQLPGRLRGPKRSSEKLLDPYCTLTLVAVPLHGVPQDMPPFPRRRSNPLPSLCGRVREVRATFRGIRRFPASPVPASQVNALGADFMHQGCAFAVGTVAVGHGVNELAGFVENGGTEIGQPV